MKTLDKKFSKRWVGSVECEPGEIGPVINQITEELKASLKTVDGDAQKILQEAEAAARKKPRP